MEEISPQPIYLQLKNILLEKITSGVYPVGSCLPSERILGEAYHISRISVRKTLECLVEEGYIEKSANKRSIIRKGYRHTGRTLAFASTRPHNVMLDVYRMFYDALLMKCNTRGDSLYYLDISRPLSAAVADITFNTIIVTDNSPDMEKRVRKSFPKTPLIALDNVAPTSEIYYVSTDNRQGGKLAAEYLIEHGSRKMLFLGVTPAYQYQPFVERKEAFLAAVNRRDVHCDVMDMDDALPETIERNLSVYLKGNRPDAVFCFNDHIAITVLKVFYNLHIRVPGDISVMGYDGLEIGKYMIPALTTVAQPVNAITNAVLESLDRGDKKSRGRQIAPSITELESVMSR